MSLSDANPCSMFMNSQHSHSRSVDRATDTMIASVPEPTRSVFDGSSLLQRIPWQHETR